MPPRAGFQVSQRQLADALAPQEHHARAHRLEHAAHQPVVALVHRDPQVDKARIRGVLGQQRDLCAGGAVAVVQRQAVFQPPQRLLGQFAVHAREIELFHLAFGVGDGLH